ncbi:unnamed protein product [Pelagomonas calceolata]|uniref:Uncharacterized protein n=1 Tax=Pelagomonas calceolata TaxID=35677 RepID=A0A7S4A329_9STRA|nr:unnamed protein product [Pelagomonas calceolata]
MSEDAPLLTASSRRRGGAVLAAVVLALAGGLAFAVANRSDTTTSLSDVTAVHGDAYAQALPASTSQDVTKAKGTSTKYRPEQIFSLSQHAVEPPGDKMMQLNSGLHGKVGSIEKWLLIVIVVLGAVCLLCCVCCIIHVGTCGIL